MECKNIMHGLKSKLMDLSIMMVYIDIAHKRNEDRERTFFNFETIEGKALSSFRFIKAMHGHWISAFSLDILF